MSSKFAVSPLVGSGKRLGTRPQGGLTPRVRTMVEAMINEGLPRPEAAERAGLSDRAAREAFHKPAVLAHYNRELEVLRTGEKARNLRRGIQLRDQARSEKVQLEAARWLHGEDHRGGVNVNVGVGVHLTPGYVIDLRDPEPQRRPAQTIEHEPAEPIR